MGQRAVWTKAGRAGSMPLSGVDYSNEGATILIGASNLCLAVHCVSDVYLSRVGSATLSRFGDTPGWHPGVVIRELWQLAG